MARVLLVNPSYLRTYGSNQAGIANPVYPILSLACLAGIAKADGHQAKIVDFSYRAYDPESLKQTILDFRPDVLGITATTPLVNQLKDISMLAKSISAGILTIGGGSHPSSLPVVTMQESALDMVVFGEGDLTFREILAGMPAATINGVAWRDGDRIVQNAPRMPIPNLDDLPMPAWELYPIDEYRDRITRIIARYPPISTVEFSRGCVFTCDFCGSKQTMAKGYRKKSPERCAEELEVLHALGYREALLTDDIFSSDNNWAVAVCEAIKRRGVKMAWTCTNGIRVDSANAALFRAMKGSGCYRVHFGFETGNDRVLKAFGKGGRASLEQGRIAVAEARAAGLETWGMFMIGLSADDEASMDDTISYARSLDVDVKKLGITVPFPGTPMFRELHEQGRIRSYDWDDYNVYNEASAVFDHPRLSWDVIRAYYRKAYLSIYYRSPGYIVRRLLRSLKTGDFLLDIYYGAKFFFVLNRKVAPSAKEQYAFEERWRALTVPPRELVQREYQIVRASNGRSTAAEGAVAGHVHRGQ